MNGYDIVSEATRYTQSQIKQIVINIIEKQTGIRIKNINDKLVDLGIDSLDAVEIIMALEEKFDIDISKDTEQEFIQKGGGLTTKSLILIVTYILSNAGDKDKIAKNLLRRIK